MNSITSEKIIHFEIDEKSGMAIATSDQYEKDLMLLANEIESTKQHTLLNMELNTIKLEYD